KREQGKGNTVNTQFPIGYGPDDIRLAGSSSVLINNSMTKNDVIDIFATYNKTIAGDHAFKLLGGYNQEVFEIGNEAISRGNLISSSLPYLVLATANPTVSAG